VRQADTYRKTFRIVIACWLIGWFCKIGFYEPYLCQVTGSCPLAHALFPPFFLNNTVSLVFYFLPVMATFSFIIDHPLVHRLNALIMLFSASVLSLHINTYNDATFVTSFWVALWLLWFAFHMTKDDGAFIEKATLLGQSIIGLVFLGGFVGKLTTDYFSGEVLYHIFIEQTQESMIGRLFSFTTQETAMMGASVLSKIIIAGEFMLAFNVVVISRSMILCSLVLIPVLTLFSTWRILSVISCLLGLLIALWYLSKEEGSLSL
jgi:hypothetical protein